MSNQPGATPPGFYPAEGGRRRYWDGKGWTDRYEGPEAAAGPPAASAGKSSGGPRRWWLLPTIALFIGIGLGGVGKSDGTTGAAAPTVTATVTKAGAAGSPAATVTAPAVTVTAPAPAATVTAPAVTVTAPAPAPVTVTAPAAPAAPPPGPGASVGDGVYVVGQDMQPGTYRVSGAVTDGCYWAITKSGSNGADIVQNDLPKGGFPQVTVKAGQDFKSERCGTWFKK